MSIPRRGISRDMTRVKRIPHAVRNKRDVTGWRVRVWCRTEMGRGAFMLKITCRFERCAGTHCTGSVSVRACTPRREWNILYYIYACVCVCGRRRWRLNFVYRLARFTCQLFVNYTTWGVSGRVCVYYMYMYENVNVLCAACAFSLVRATTRKRKEIEFIIVSC